MNRLEWHMFRHGASGKTSSTIKKIQCPVCSGHGSIFDDSLIGALLGGYKCCWGCKGSGKVNEPMTLRK